MNTLYGSGSRHITIDVLRGYFILSMTSGHLAEGFVTDLLHLWVWVDGAAGFVCLSGFVLGLSQRARWERGSRAAQWWMLRRAAQIWVISVALTLLALLARAFVEELSFIENVFTAERLPSALAELLLLDLHVPYFGILAMYVVFLLFAPLAVMALKRNRDSLVLLAALAVYVVSQIAGAAGNLADADQPTFSRAAWQLLFFVGLVAGWRWRDRLQPVLSAYRTPIFAASALAVAAFLLLAHGSKVPGLAALDWDLDGYFEKFTLSPPVVVYFACVLAFLASLVEWLRRFRSLLPLFHVAALFGRHSLACFVLLSLLQLVTWVALAPAEPHDARHIAWFAVALVLLGLYCLAAERGMPRPRRSAGERRDKILLPTRATGRPAS